MCDGLVLALRLGVVTAHQPLQFGKFADDFGQQIGLAQLRGAFGFRRIGADDRRKLTCKGGDARNTLGLGAQLLMENDLLEFRQPVFQPRLQVGVVEELGVGQPRADHSLVAGDNCLAAVAASSFATRMNLLTSFAVCGSRSTKHFWLLRMVARITSSGIDRNA